MDETTTRFYDRSREPQKTQEAAVKGEVCPINGIDEKCLTKSKTAVDYINNLHLEEFSFQGTE